MRPSWLLIENTNDFNEKPIAIMKQSVELKRKSELKEGIYL